METLEFNPQSRLSTADQVRLRREADRLGVSEADYIEVVLKRALFAPETPSTLEPSPRPKSAA